MVAGIWASGNDVFAVGAFLSGTPSILHWDGSSWTHGLPVVGHDVELYGVGGSSADDVFAVGTNGTILHRNGDAWELVPSGTTADLRGVWAAAAHSAFAVRLCQNQRLVHKTRESVQDRLRSLHPTSHDRFRGFEAPATAKNAPRQ